MALVNYSDSDSEPEAPPTVPKPQPAKPIFQKIGERSASGKIKIDLPSLQADPVQPSDSEPPAKRAKARGAFSNFNALLPAPKRRVQGSIKPGISLKTSGEAAFIREVAGADDRGSSQSLLENNGTSNGTAIEVSVISTEPKLVGKATRFVPLSVANRRKKQSRPPQDKDALAQNSSKSTDTNRLPNAARDTAQTIPHEEEQVKLNPKRSLFLASQREEKAPILDDKADTYEPLLETNSPVAAMPDTWSQPDRSTPAQVVNPSSLEIMASDLDLTAAQRRQLFGRNAKDANVAHFNMEAEYAANEELRKAGEVVQHRAVKSIAPGKHSLQQLVNNARSQKDAMEDAWAEGRKNRGEGGSKYGWS